MMSMEEIPLAPTHSSLNFNGTMFPAKKFSHVILDEDTDSSSAEVPAVHHKTQSSLGIKELFGSVGCFFTSAVAIVLSPTMICMGAVYINECPKQTYIPVFLIVAGSLTIVITALSMILNHITKRGSSPDDEKSPQPRTLLAITNLLRGLTFSWYTAGCTWVYSAYEPNYVLNPQEPWNYCNKNFYLFSFWILTSILIIIGLALVLALIILIIGIVTSS